MNETPMMDRCVTILVVAGVFLVTLAQLRGAPVHEAAAGGDAARLEALLRADPAAVNPRDQYERTPLYVAVLNDKHGLDMATVLLEHGAEVDAESIVGTPLQAAVGRERLDLVRLLLKHGADPNRRDKRGGTALGTAILFGDRGLDMTEALLDRGGRPDGGMLRTAVSYNAPRLVRLLIRHGADPNAGRGETWNPVRLAVDRRNEPMLRLLVELGADINLRAEERRRSVLHDLAEFGKPSLACVDLVVSLGADVNATDRYGVTPLVVAVANRRVETAKRLLAHKAHPDALHAIGSLPVREPADPAADYDLARLLVEQGADPRVKDEDGLSPFWRLLRFRRRDIVEVILAAGAKADVFTLLELGRSDAAREAIAARPETVRERYYTGEAPLHLAVRQGLDDVVALCLARDADPNARDASGYTPLHLAARHGRLDAAKRLLDAGADVNARTRAEWLIGGIDRYVPSRTPLQEAGDNADMVDLLLRHGAERKPEPPPAWLEWLPRR